MYDMYLCVVNVCVHARMYVFVYVLCIRVSHVPSNTAPTLPFMLSPSLFLFTGCSYILQRAMGEGLTAPTWGSKTPSVLGRWSSLPDPPCAALQGKCKMYEHM